MKYLFIEKSDGIGIITINRPDAMNAMNSDVVSELSITISDMIADKEIGVIIITGSREKAFVAGADIKAMQQMNAEDALEFGKTGQEMTLVIENSPKPVIAAVNGFALGGGCEISLACHIRVASENAIFGQPEVLLGLIPGWGGTQRLPKIVGTGIANELIITGNQISAQEAHRIGLVNHVVTQTELMDTCKEIGKKILNNGPNAIAKSLNCIHESFDKSIEDGLEFEVKAFANLFSTEETKEGLSAFVEKRKANFRP
ncbi:MAG TPA: enoyl-CoA hydratase-related protein [Candidatus Marinimicrobia bacterium]|jgi:enoyl-CoA hydratase|nr:enoyl-CoA hydratase-related protein [Candidatus Neomarinimicrobiota bacterium]